jgi:hypothetical protein
LALSAGPPEPTSQRCPGARVRDSALLACFTPRECANYFANAGHAPRARKLVAQAGAPSWRGAHKPLTRLLPARHGIEVINGPVVLRELPAKLFMPLHGADTGPTVDRLKKGPKPPQAPHGMKRPYCTL